MGGARCGASLPPFRGAAPMPKITAYILAYNQAEKIQAAVSGVLWADEVLVVDSYSTDKTRALAEALGARVVDVPFKGGGGRRGRARGRGARGGGGGRGAGGRG